MFRVVVAAVLIVGSACRDRASPPPSSTTPAVADVVPDDAAPVAAVVTSDVIRQLDGDIQVREVTLARSGVPMMIKIYRSTKSAGPRPVIVIAGAGTPLFLGTTLEGAAADMDVQTQRMPIYQLRITLADTEPPVWRTVLASGNLSFKKLNEIIQAAMGWTNSHLHAFASMDRKVALSDPRFGLDHARDESKVKLRSFAPEVGSRFRYEYDFGDSWQHDVLVEAILPPGKSGRTPRCVDGQRACPPEDCGGVPGYADLVAAMQDRHDPDRQRFLEWLGHEYDPEAFSLEEANDRLRRLK